MVTNPIQQTCQICPQVMGDGIAIFIVEIDRIHQLAINIELELVGGTVADAHGRRLLIALQVGKAFFGQDVPSIDAVEYLQGPIWGSRRYWRKIYGKHSCEPSATGNFLPCAGRTLVLQFSPGIVALRFG
jgi:hypothetical protein